MGDSIAVTAGKVFTMLRFASMMICVSLNCEQKVVAEYMCRLSELTECSEVLPLAGPRGALVTRCSITVKAVTLGLHIS